jgi:ribosomal 30S subunit maturation factor RimM
MSDPRIVNMIVRLIEETVTGRVSWKIGDAPRAMTLGTNDIYSLFVETEFRGTRFCMYEVRSKHYRDEDDFYWVDYVNFAVLDDRDRVLWTVKEIPEVYELFADVKRKVAGVDKLLDYFR